MFSFSPQLAIFYLLCCWVLLGSLRIKQNNMECPIVWKRASNKIVGPAPSMFKTMQQIPIAQKTKDPLLLFVLSFFFTCADLFWGKKKLKTDMTECFRREMTLIFSAYLFSFFWVVHNSYFGREWRQSDKQHSLSSLIFCIFDYDKLVNSQFAVLPKIPRILPPFVVFWWLVHG